MRAERLQQKSAFRQHDRQYHNYRRAAFAGIEQLANCPSMLLVILNPIADNEIRVYNSSLAHRARSRRAVSAAPSRISAKDISFPLLLASAPLSDLMPGCTRMVARSPSTEYPDFSPGLIRKAFRIFSGMVVCPLLARHVRHEIVEFIRKACAWRRR